MTFFLGHGEYRLRLPEYCWLLVQRKLIQATSSYKAKPPSGLYCFLSNGNHWYPAEEKVWCSISIDFLFNRIQTFQSFYICTQPTSKQYSLCWHKQYTIAYNKYRHKLMPHNLISDALICLKDCSNVRAQHQTMEVHCTLNLVRICWYIAINSLLITAVTARLKVILDSSRISPASSLKQLIACANTQRCS